jgi:hypothetical protein
MIDIDDSRFTTRQAYKLAVSKTLKNIEKEISGKPTVIWSGNGNHVIQPMDAVELLYFPSFSI